jgi:hypothetical protein
VIARSQSSERRLVNNSAIAALLGAGVLIWGLGGVCMLALLIVAVVVGRRWLWGLFFPNDRVAVWHYDVFDHDRQGAYGVVIYDPDGVPPGEQSVVRIRGRRTRNAFRASSILRELDPNGVPVLGRDGLVARAMPPMWVGMLLLGCGSLLIALRWAAAMGWVY